MNTTSLSQSIRFQDTEINIIDHEGAPWVAAADLARGLGYSDVRKVTHLYSRHKDEFTPEMSEVLTLGLSGNLQKKQRIFSSRGCYLIAMLTRTDRAKAFREWVLDVLEGTARPSINLDDPAQLRGLLSDYADKAIALQAELEEVKPKADALDLIALKDGDLCITDAAKTLCLRPKDLFAWMRLKKWIYRRAGNAHWVGYQDKIQDGYLDHKVTDVTRSDGRSKIVEAVRVTSKGLSRLAEIHMKAPLQ